ncbi:MAG: globin [Acetobacteraceae bacterium]|nr:globin [Acetobacteraceae bacterium]
MNRDAIVESLELLAARDIDPTRAVYARLFAESPEMEALFIRDHAYSIRGQMVQMVLENLLDYATSQSFGLNMIRAERVNHAGMGVPQEVFGTFFGVVQTTVGQLLGADWTPAMDQAWTELIARLQEEIVA